MPDLSKKNYYEILGVAKDASNEELRSAYKELAKIYHPDSQFYNDIIDTPLSEKDKETFRLITHVYEVLSDPEKRVEYDLSLEPNLVGNIRAKIENESNLLYTNPTQQRKSNLPQSLNKISSSHQEPEIRSVADMINEFHSEHTHAGAAILKGIAFGVGMALLVYLIIRLVD